MLKAMIQHYPDKQAANILVNGFTEGFRLEYCGPRIHVMSRNLLSAYQYPQELQSLIDNEIDKGRVLGPFDKLPLSNLRISPVGLVPKKSGGWRLITHLSSPQGFSINDFIDPSNSTVSYSSFDNTLKLINNVGPGALLGKMDVKSAFRLLPIHPADFCLLGFSHTNKFYIDKCLPMGCSISCNLFEKLSTFIHWATENHAALSTMDHYLDDFIFIGLENTLQCATLMSAFENVCSSLGVPIAPEKTEGPVTCLTYLGLVINTNSMTISIPEAKLLQLKLQLQDLVSRKKVTLRQLQSLVGSLAFCCRALPAGRAFNRRFYSAMAGASKPFHFIRVSSGLKEDANVWLKFLNEFNGSLSIVGNDWLCEDTLQLFTDSSRLGCGAYFNGSWVCIEWPKSWSQQLLQDMTFLELIPILLSIFVWSKDLENKKIYVKYTWIYVIWSLGPNNPKVTRHTRQCFGLVKYFNFFLINMFKFLQKYKNV